VPALGSAVAGEAGVGRADGPEVAVAVAFAVGRGIGRGVGLGVGFGVGLGVGVGVGDTIRIGRGETVVRVTERLPLPFVAAKL
jgi:hypothetical protein